MTMYFCIVIQFLHGSDAIISTLYNVYDVCVLYMCVVYLSVSIVQIFKIYSTNFIQCTVQQYNWASKHCTWFKIME